jgi:hypothetical protein
MAAAFVAARPRRPWPFGQLASGARSRMMCRIDRRGVDRYC